MNRAKWIIAGALFCTLAGCSRQQPIQAKHDTGPVSVTSSAALGREIQRVVEGVGSLYAFDETIVSAEIEGRIDQVHMDLGDRVVAGQVLIHISDEEQRYLLQQNEAQLQQSLERLGLRDEKDRVKDIRQTPDVRKAEADLFDAEQRFRRVNNLVDQGIASKADLDQATSRYKSLQAGLDNTINQTRNLISDVERAKAVVNLQRKKLRDTSVRAPYDAFVKERQVTVGQYVRANTPLLTLVKTDPIRLRIEVPERMAPWVRNGQIAEVMMEAFGTRKFHGKIWRISPTVDQTKRTFIVEALIDNPDAALKPGSYAKARIPTAKIERITLVPARAVNYVLGSNRAYVIKGGVIEAREVKLGDRFDEQVEIMEGVQEGEEVATSQLARLDTGAKVTIGEPAQRQTSAKVE